MQKAMIQIFDKWIVGYCDYFKHQIGEIITGFGFEKAQVVVSVEKVVNSQDGRNWFHALRDATDEEIESANSTEEISFGSFLDMFADSK